MAMDRGRCSVGQGPSREIGFAGHLADHVGLEPVRQRDLRVVRSGSYLEEHEIAVEVLVDLPLQAVIRYGVPSLPDSATGGQRPDALEQLGVHVARGLGRTGPGGGTRGSERGGARFRAEGRNPLDQTEPWKPALFDLLAGEGERRRRDAAEQEAALDLGHAGWAVGDLLAGPGDRFEDPVG